MKKDIIVCQSYYRAVEKRKQEELMKKRIKTDNELIAIFMGLKILRYETCVVADRKPYKEKTPVFDLFPKELRPDQLEYEISWDSLMPVVEEIERLEELDEYNRLVWPYQVEILSRKVVQIVDNRTDEPIVLINQDNIKKIDSVYKAVVAFIKWHNQNKKLV